MPRVATVQVRPGVTGVVVLPNGRKIEAGDTAVKIGWEHFEKLTAEALRTKVQVTAVSEAPAAKRTDVDLTYNGATVPTGFRLGQVVDGFGQRDHFKLVKVVDSVAVTRGMALAWASKIADTVTPDRVGGTAATPLAFAGIAVNAITAGNYGWIQVDGVTDVPASVGSAGDALVLHPTVDGTLRTFTGDEVAVVTNGGASAGNLTLTYDGQTTANIAFNATAATVQTALENLSNIAVGDVVVTGTNLTGAGVTITFAGDLADANLTDLTVSSTGLTGGPATVTITQGYSDQVVDLVGISLGADGVNLAGIARHPYQYFRNRGHQK